MDRLMNLVAVSLLLALVAGAVSCASEAPGGNTNTLSPTAAESPEPTSTPNGFIGAPRQAGSLKVYISTICLGSEDTLRLEMTIENVGNSTLSVTELLRIPLAGPAVNPTNGLTHACLTGIPPGQRCFLRYSDGTHIEFPADYVGEETYLVVLAENDAGAEYGVTFTLPPLNRLFGCTD